VVRLSPDRAEVTAPEAPPPRGGAEAVRILLWRHGQTTWNAQHRWQGQSDPELSELGEQQAARAARYVAAFQPDALWSSDLRRAADTAARLSALTGLPVTQDKRLRERSGGSFEGLTDVECRERFPEAWAASKPPGGEASPAVAERMAEILERIAAGAEPGSLTVAVSHGGAINLGISRLLGVPDEARVLGVLGNCAWSVLGRRRGQWRLLEHNSGTLPEPVPDG
jgi:broad specificity phosphatase PhoE